MTTALYSERPNNDLCLSFDIFLSNLANSVPLISAKVCVEVTPDPNLRVTVGLNSEPARFV